MIDKKTTTKNVVLIIDDDELFCDAVKDYIESESIEVLTAYKGSDGIACTSRRRVDVVLLDQMLPDVVGHTLCPEILRNNEETKIIFITAHPSFEGAIKAIRAGAHDYLSKPFELEELSLAIERAMMVLSLEKVAQVEDYRRHKEIEEAVLVGEEGGLSEVAKLVDLAANSRAPVLITGETGAGKNVVAKAIHFRSAAREGVFITINCAALPENLIEAELFGHEKGAFTGATSSKRGIFEMAEGGTLFLDEIGEMPAHLQTKLLGVLEDKQIRRIGGETIRPVDVRIIAATATDLESARESRFRNDLYYRLSVIRIHVPPLRERKQDIPELCEYLMVRLVSNLYLKLPDSELKKLALYDWPGNVRELRNILERACILQKDQVIMPSELLENPCPRPTTIQDRRAEADAQSLAEVEKNHIKLVLERHAGNITRTAKALGIAHSTLKRKLKAHGIK